jgi:hypothetical protein
MWPGKYTGARSAACGQCPRCCNNERRDDREHPNEALVPDTDASLVEDEGSTR